MRSFNVAYRFIMQDGFSAVSNKIRVGNKRLGKSFGALRKQLKLTDKQIKNTNSSFASGLKGYAAGALAFVSLGAAFQTVTKFEDSLADLSAITGAVGKDLDILKSKTLSMAKASVSSQSDVAEAIKLVASAKPDLLSNIDALTATTEQVLLLKNASGIDLASAANITAQGLNIFGASADQAGRFVNVLAAGAKLGSSEIAQTGEAMLVAGPGARAAGLSFEQLNASIQTVAKSGIKGSQAGTALNAIFGRLRRAGIDFAEVGLEGAFDLVSDALDKTSSSTERAQLEAKIFGEEHAKVGLALIENRSLLSEYGRTLAGTNIAQEQANIRMNTFSTRLRSIGVLLQEKVIKVFGKASAGIDMAASSFKSFVSGLDPSDIEALGIVLSGLGAVLAGLVKTFSFAFSGIMLVIKPVLAVLKGIGEIIGEVTAAVATLDFSGLKDTFSFDGLSDSFSLGGSFLGVFGGEKSPVSEIGSPASNQNINFKSIGSNSKTTTDVNINLNAPKGIIGGVQTANKGRQTANVGVNMVMG